MEATITAVEFKPTDRRSGNMDVIVTLSDGTSASAFFYYSDELSFSAEELLGLTLVQASALKVNRDLAYIRSPKPGPGSLGYSGPFGREDQRREARCEAPARNVWARRQAI